MVSEFDAFFDRNPREHIPDSLKSFLDYAISKYDNLDCVNMCYADDDESNAVLVKDYVGDSAEILLLFNEFRNVSVKKLLNDLKSEIQSEQFRQGLSTTPNAIHTIIDKKIMELK